ncbi:hypothetical protein H7U32_09025 [Bifidobacterium pullorum subsp. saeculare]|uniref:Bacterial SCP orthologue domain-containing protein n=1 Tax=Bifidobacterium pullorum subsp. saeculare TaxID=78257 RepID=A0A939BAE1_9BIFI|nr:sterol carrier family protein [Bifidobacterium pullorum]MBM6700429.1 hypothetical protein [Bifidobacterium pullorum subsp. saeculare]
MPAIREQDLPKGRAAWADWRQAAAAALADAAGAITPDQPDAADAAAPATRPEPAGAAGLPAAVRMAVAPQLPRATMAMAVRYTIAALEHRAPGPGVEVRVAPFAAVKILDGPASDPHNLTPPDVIELKPAVWLRLAAGVTSWAEEREAGHITAVGERDDLSALLPLQRL